jgi:hypothetical protein
MGESLRQKDHSRTHLWRAPGTRRVTQGETFAYVLRRVTLRYKGQGNKERWDVWVSTVSFSAVFFVWA